jgi:hypothetical protein
VTTFFAKARGTKAARKHISTGKSLCYKQAWEKYLLTRRMYWWHYTHALTQDSRSQCEFN